ncbi:MAG: endolytic transglycosylase MltG [Patescibacteria group bacterium]
MKKKFLVPILLCLLAFFSLRSYYRTALHHPSPTTEEQVITIPSGLGVAQVADLLYQENLINSKPLFQLYIYLNDLASTLQAGKYVVPPQLTVVETVELLQHGTFDHRLTFLEGWRREEMAEYFQEKLGEPGLEDDFLAASQDKEGYLFPETYRVSHDVTAEELVQLMCETFEEKFTTDLEDTTRERGLRVEEVVILASLVEREARESEDRPKVAGILVKRWENDWPLEVDATVQYVVGSGTSEQGWWPEQLTSSDLEIDSPYNTRKYKGLPPGPICNPGLDALEAVVYNEETPYWYYVSDSEGKVYFSKTLDEHNVNVLKYVRRR